jgi:hypothetical protein
VNRENRPLTVREVFEEAGISKILWHTIFTEEQEIRHVAARVCSHVAHHP